MNILFFGNCQLFALYQKLIKLKECHNVVSIQCFRNVKSKAEFDMIIQNQDIILTSFINYDYKIPYYCTHYVVNNSKKECKVIVLPSIFFDFYYFDIVSNIKLRIPVDYHYYGMIYCYLNDMSFEDYINKYVKNNYLHSATYLENRALLSFKEMNYRDNLTRQILGKFCFKKVCYLSPTNYIMCNYKDKLLFHSSNHPTKYVFNCLCIHICKELGFDFEIINYQICPLEKCKCIIYKCIQNVVNFKVDDVEVRINDVYGLWDVCKKYYDSYDNLDNESFKQLTTLH